MTAQDQPQPLTSVALWKVSPGNTETFIARAKAFTPTLDKLLADGIVSAYGLDVDILHIPGTTNIAYWYTTANHAGLEKAEAAIEGFIKSKGQLMKDLDALHDASAHRDLIVRSLEHKFRKPSGNGMPVWDFTMDKVKEGMGRDYIAGWRSYAKPVYDKLFADGVICGILLGLESFAVPRWEG